MVLFTIKKSKQYIFALPDVLALLFKVTGYDCIWIILRLTRRSTTYQSKCIALTFQYFHKIFLNLLQVFSLKNLMNYSVIQKFFILISILFYSYLNKQKRHLSLCSRFMILIAQLIRFNCSIKYFMNLVAGLRLQYAH